MKKQIRTEKQRRREAEEGRSDVAIVATRIGWELFPPPEKPPKVRLSDIVGKPKEELARLYAQFTEYYGYISECLAQAEVDLNRISWELNMKYSEKYVEVGEKTSSGKRERATVAVRELSRKKMEQENVVTVLRTIQRNVDMILIAIGKERFERGQDEQNS